MTTRDHDTYRVMPFPASRRFALDAGWLARRKHIVHGLLEVDVTTARRHLREHRARTGESLSFTAYVVTCLARAVETNKEVQACRNWRNQLIVFDDVNVDVLIEVDSNGRKFPMPHILRAANTKSFREVHAEIRAAQAAPATTTESKFMRWFLPLPGFARHLFYRVVTGYPQMLRKHTAPVHVTAVGMFAKETRGWAVPMPSFSLTVTLGGTARQPGVVEERIEIREVLHVTLSFDHDVVDGAPAARFTQQFRELVESGYGLSGD